MPIEAHWYNEEQTILVLTYTDPWTVRDVIERLDEVETMLNDTPHREVVDALLDMQHTQNLPKDLLRHLTDFLRAPALHHPQAGLIVTTSTINRVHESFNRIFSAMIARVEMADSEEEALAIIREAKLKRAKP